MGISEGLALFLHDMVERVHWREESERNSAHATINAETEAPAGVETEEPSPEGS